ncbi:prominin-2 isoform X1 [Copidosoma floridanum]|uniref:prominin-2 isoform X1 n=1 Tax=Copidosoma floridanum TaxID=29053 RepID=UPI0006C9D921|nr:prominin-2 isoform X1 [Copidosoma floridanum]
MTGCRATATLRLLAGLIAFVTSLSPALLQGAHAPDASAPPPLNCSTTESYGNLEPTRAHQMEEPKAFRYRQSSVDGPQHQQQHRDEDYNARRADRYLGNPTLDKYSDDMLRGRQEENDHRDGRPLFRRYQDDYEERRRYFDEEDDTTSLKVQPLGKEDTSVGPLNKNQDDQHVFAKYPDVHSVGGHPINPYPNRHADDLELNRRANEESRKFNDRQSTDQNSKVHPSMETAAIPRPNYATHESKTNTDQQPNRRLDHPIEKSTNQRADKNTDDPYSRKHYDGISDNTDKHDADPYPNRHLDHLYPDGRSSDRSYERQLVDHYPDRRLGFPDPLPDRHRQAPLDNERFDGRNPDFERRLGDLVPDKNRDLTDLHPDGRVEGPNVEKHPDAKQQPTGFGKDDIRPDRRLSDDDYRARVTFKQSSLEHDDEDQHSDVKVERLHPESRFDDGITGDDDDDDDASKGPRKESNVSHLVTFASPNDWDEYRPKLHFPKKSGDERYKMATLHLDKGLFIFDFLRSVLSILLPRNVPIDLLKDTLEGNVDVSTLISKSIHLELVFIAVVIILGLLMFVVPSTECYLCCKSHQYKYKRTRQGSTVCFLCIFAIVIGACVMTMLVTNEQVNAGIERIPETVEAALQDLRDYNSGTANQLRKCMTRSLDIASEAILADLDNVEELLGKPVQAQLSQETGVDVALEALMDVANATTELAYKTDGLLKRAERAREFGSEFGREVDDLRRELERTTRDCGPEDRSLCAVIDPSGLHLALRLERLARDDRLVRLRSTSRDNLTEVGRQARGEYLYVPHHVARTTLEARNRIRREINTARAKVSDEARSIEASGSDLTNQLDQVRRIKDEVTPYVQKFENIRWIVGFATAMCLLFLWLILFAALLCRCGCCEHKVRPTLLWFACLSCLTSIALWLVLIASLAIASHAEMLLCRPLDDPEYRTVEAVLETRVFLGRRLSVPMKDLFEKCEQHGSVYPAYQLDSTQRLDQLTAYWSWAGLKRAFGRLKVDLSGLRIFSPNLREKLQNLLYATGPNLTEHRVMIQGPILNKDLNALSEQVENVARQLSDRRTARAFQTIAVQMRDLLSRRVKPLMKMQDELVYQLAALDIHLQPLQSQVNRTLVQLRDVQYHIDNQGDKIGQLKAKAYVDRLSGYLDQWRAHVLTEVSSGVSKCRPLWDILRGIKLLFCSHILGPLNGYWFSLFVCVVTLLICTPTAHNLASSYWTQPSKSSRGSVLLSRQGSPDTVVLERETWQTPRPAPSMDSW